MKEYEIKARENGPYKFVGKFTYVDENGETKTTTKKAMALCRCGHSADKPFCDGSHRQTGFEAPELYFTLHLIND